jgi:polysaccharide export outer membrane protein
MNFCLFQSFARKWPEVLINLIVAGVLVLVAIGTCGVARAAEAAATNVAASDRLAALKHVMLMEAAVTNAASSNQVTSLSAAVSTPDSTNAFNALDDKYRLTIGDQLSFQIIEDEEDPKSLVVTDSGDLQVPYIGRYPAVGKTCKELSLALKRELEKEYYVQATVIIAVDLKPRSRGKIYVVGAVGAPGPQDIVSEEVLTVSKAVSRAGGLTGTADGKKVRVTRSAGDHAGDETNFIVNVSRIFEKGKTEIDPPLQPGDLIFVPERMIRF